MTLRLLLPIPAILMGAYISHEHGIAFSAFAPNFAAVILGSILLVYLNSLSSEKLDRLTYPVSVFTLLLLAFTLLAPEMEHVHRWIFFGPLRLNIGMVVAPWILYLLDRGLSQRKFLFVSTALAALVIHCFQPDAGQATAMGMGSIALVISSSQRSPLKVRIFCLIFIIGSVLFTWHQPDPLPALDHGERIFHLVWASGFLAIGGALMSIGLLFFPFFRGPINWGILFYLLGTFVVTEIGNFPVPVFGAGASTILGWYIACALDRHSSRKTKLLALSNT